MATTLQRQLAALAAPASSLLQPERRRVSIIFSKDEAAKFDKNTFYQIGIDGLNELIAICPDLFSSFRNTILFSEASKHFERAIEDAAINLEVDRLVEKFLITVSPYLMLKAALKCMEWLVYRFHIERFNVESILECIMPYYDTKHFVMIVQIIQFGSVKDSVTMNWQWLTPCIQSATVLRKATLYGNVNAPFVLWLFQTLRKFLEVHRLHPDNLSTYLGFMVATLVGIITKFSREFSIKRQYRNVRSKKTVVDVVLKQIYMLFEEILQEEKYAALRDNRDIYAVAYVVIAAIGITAEENPEIGGILGSKIRRVFNLMIQNRSVALMEETYLLIDMLVQHIYFEWTFKSKKPFQRAMKDLSLVSQNWDVSKMATRLILANANEKSILSPKKIFHWLSMLQLLPEARAEILCKVYYIYKESDLKWAKAMLTRFEMEYPSEFELACKNDTTFAKDFAKYQRGRNFLLLVDHPDEKIRAVAVRKLIKRANSSGGLKEGTSKKKVVKTKKLKQDENHIAKALYPRFADESQLVVCALLKPKLKCLLKIFNIATLLDGCITVTKVKNGNKSVRIALQKLCTLAKKFGADDAVEKRVLKVLLPFLFPRKSSGLVAAKKIIYSPYAQQNKILGEFSSLAARTESITPEEFCCHSFNVFVKFRGIYQLRDFNTTDAVELTIALLLLGHETDLLQNLMSVSKMNCAITTDYPFSPSNFSKCLMVAEKKRCISLEIILAGILEMNVKDFATRLNIVKFVWTRSEIESNRGACMKFLNEFLQKTFDEPPRQFWFWLSVLHVVSTLPVNAVDQESELMLIRCLQFFSRFVTENGIPASVDSEQSSTSVNAARSTNGVEPHIHKPLTRSQGKADETEIQESPRKMTPKNSRRRISAKIVRQGVSPTWCLLEILFSRCIQNASAYVRSSCMKFLNAIKQVPKLSVDWEDLLNRIMMYENEMLADSSQAPVLIGRLIVEADLLSVRSQIIKTLLSEETDREIFMGLVNICQHTGTMLYDELEPMIKKLLETDPTSSQLLALLNCYEASPQSVEILPKLMQNKGSSKIVLKQLNNRLFSKASNEFKKKLFTLMVDCAVDCKHPEIKLAIQRCIRKWDMDSSLISEAIKKCMGPERLVAATKRKSVKRDPSDATDENDVVSDWKERAEVILEFVQGMKRLTDRARLLPPLFRILKICISLEEQSPVEYLKQLTLTALTICCGEENDDEQGIDSGTFHVELVIDCLRCSRNPQTHHHALILLNYAAKRFQEQVLHGVMSLFTFMGNSILRQDDTYSTQLIQQTVTTIIPALTKAGKGSHPHFSKTVVSAGIFRVFASALQDIPVHRRLPVFTSLVETLSPNECLWQVLIIIVDNALNRDRKRSNLNADLELAVDLAWSCEPATIVQGLAQVYDFFISLSTIYKSSVSDEEFRSFKNRQTPVEKAVFDFSRKECIRDIQIVIHYTLELLVKISSKFTEADNLKLDYDVILERCLSFSRLVSGLSMDKIFRMISHRNFEVVEKINAVLEAEDFIRVISVILERNDFPIKRKILDMFNLRLSQKIEWFGDLTILLPLLNPLLEVSSMNPEADDVVTLIQTAFLSLKLIAKHLAFSHPEEFVPVLQLALDHAAHENQLLCASALLCIGELFCLKGLLLPRLNEVTSALLRAFKTSSKLHKLGTEIQSSEEIKENGETSVQTCLDGDASITTAHLLCISAIACMNKMTEQLGPLMGSKFIKKALILILTIDSQLASGDVTTSRKKTFDQRFRILLKSLSTKIPVRNSLIPLKSAFHSLVDKPKAVKSIMIVLKDSLQVTTKPDFVLILPALCDSFMDEFLAWRDNITKVEGGPRADDVDKNQDEINDVENDVIDCLISGAVLKMSEGIFRPYYHKLFDWARDNSERLITFYRFSAAAAERLKSLFVTFAGYVMTEAVNSLSVNIELTKGILSFFYHLFSNDREGFVTTDRFNAVVKPLVDLIESEYVLRGHIELESVSNTLIQLAVASDDLNRWQHMVDLISTKAHHSIKQVRLNVVQTLEAAAAELAKDFLPLLPSVVPFLAELMNDDEPDVEAATQKMLLKLETIVGEPLQPYFT